MVCPEFMLVGQVTEEKRKARFSRALSPPPGLCLTNLGRPVRDLPGQCP